jgi:hypothetical protein
MLYVGRVCARARVYNFRAQDYTNPIIYIIKHVDDRDDDDDDYYYCYLLWFNETSRIGKTGARAVGAMTTARRLIQRIRLLKYITRTRAHTCARVCAPKTRER